MWETGGDIDRWNASFCLLFKNNNYVSGRYDDVSDCIHGDFLEQFRACEAKGREIKKVKLKGGMFIPDRADIVTAIIDLELTWDGERWRPSGLVVDDNDYFNLLDDKEFGECLTLEQAEKL